MEEQKLPETTSCKGSVMSRIECGEVCPRSKTFFQTRECLVWLLWLVSVVVGALAVAVTLFVVSYRQYGLYEATHDNFFTFMVDVLPFLWIVVFGLMVLIGMYELRHTKRGYRYPLWQIFGSSVVLSLAGGSALQLFGLGYATDHVLGQHMNMYNSQEKIEEKMWQDPDDGRLTGKQDRPLMPPATTVDFTDIRGELWHIDISDLSESEVDLLAQERTVRLIGVLKNEEAMLFHGCGVFPWTLDKPTSREDLSAAREAFRQKIHGYGERAEHAALRMTGTFDEEEASESPCAEIKPVRRFEGR